MKENTKKTISNVATIVGAGAELTLAVTGLAGGGAMVAIARNLMSDAIHFKNRAAIIPAIEAGVIGVASMVGSVAMETPNIDKVISAAVDNTDAAIDRAKEKRAAKRAAKAEAKKANAPKHLKSKQPTNDEISLLIIEHELKMA